MRNWQYTRLFAGGAHTPEDHEVNELLAVLDELGNSGDAVFGAGYTYFGQFIDHDLTFLLENAREPQLGELDRFEPLDDRRLLESLTLARKPTLDLDGVYGGGPPDSIVPFDKVNGKFILGHTQSKKDRDLKRTPDFRARIGDPRNDQNLFVAQIQVLFMNLHNRIVEDLIDNGETNPDALFAKARAETIKVYQYLALHDFLGELLPGRVYRRILLNGEGGLSELDKQDPTMSLEFAEAAFRLHSLVRASYRLNGRKSVDLREVIALTGAGKSAASGAGPLLGEEDEVDWRHFFPFANYGLADSAQRARQISFVMNRFFRPLELPHGPPIDMLERNLMRGIRHGLCTGQHAAGFLRNEFPALSDELGLRVLDGEGDFVLAQLPAENSIRDNTPLWLYAMIEARGNAMGPLGGWLVADALRAAALNSDTGLEDVSNSRPDELYPHLIQNTRPNAERLTIEDIIVYTYGKPQGRT